MSRSVAPDDEVTNSSLATAVRNSRAEPQAGDGELVSNEAHLRFALEAGRMGTWELDLITGAFSASAQYKRNLGLGADTPLTREALAALVHPEDRERRQAALAGAIASGCGYDIDYRIVRPDGAIAWMHVRAQVAKAADGTAVRMAGIAFDTTERREAELRLELSEESLRLAAEAAEVGTWDLDFNTGVLTWSDRTKAIFGLSPHRPCSMVDFYGGLHPDDYAATAAAFASAIDPVVRATYDVEYRTIGQEDGVVRWVAARGKGLFENGVCRRALGTAIDITRRKGDAVRQGFLLDLMDRLRRLNDAGAIMDTAVQALGKQLGACRVGYGQVQPDDTTILLETCHVDGVQPLTGIFTLNSFGPHNIDRQRHGATIVVDDIAADPLSDRAVWDAIGTRAYVSVPLVRDGRFRASLFVNHRAPHAWLPEEVALIEDVAVRIWDALERARAEAELRRLNASLEAQVTSRTRELDRTWRLSPVLMVVAESDGTLVAANPAWTRVLGWTQAETLGRDVMDLVAPEDQAAGAAGMQRLAEGLPVVEYPLSFVTRTGERRRIAWTTVPEAGRLYGYGRDITDQRIAEERLLQAQKMEAVGQLTGGLAHDFNNLLAAILGGLEMLQRRVARGRISELGDTIASAQTAAERAAALTQRLLAFSRRQTLDPRPTDVNALIRGMEELIRRTVGPELQMTVQLDPNLWATLVDPHQLENALLNLCINARDAMPDGGRLVIETANHQLEADRSGENELPPGQYLSLSVSDTGIGMTQEVARRAFDPFFTTKPLGSGTGLGLSMIYGFARQSGGQARIRTAPGAGTSVRITLPRYRGEAAAAPPTGRQEDETGAVRGETVLVVDDEAAVRMLVAEVLRENGYKVVEAEDGAAGARCLEAGSPVDLLVTDVGLPGGLNGRQLADLARRSRPALQVLFITGYAEASVLGAGNMERGMQVLTKPFPLEVLVRRVRAMLQQPRGGVPAD